MFSVNLVVGGFQDFVLLSFSVGRGRVGGLERITTGFVLGDGLEMTNAWLPFVTLLFQTSGGDLVADSPLWLYWCKTLFTSSCVRKSAVYQSWDVIKDKVYLHACSCLLCHNFHTVLGIVWEFLCNSFFPVTIIFICKHFANRTTCSRNCLCFGRYWLNIPSRYWKGSIYLVAQEHLQKCRLFTYLYTILVNNTAW